MGKFLLTSIIFLLLSFTNIMAQVKKGATFLGGDIGVSIEETTNSTSTGYKENGVLLMPVFGKAVKDNLIVGAYLIYNSFKSDVYIDANDVEQKLVGGGLFVRKYKQLGKGDFAAFLQGGVSYAHEDLKTGGSTTSRGESNGSIVSMGFYPGISYRISKKLQIETGFRNLLAVRYIYRKGYNGTVLPVTFRTSRFDVFSSLENLSSLYVGFRLLLNK